MRPKPVPKIQKYGLIWEPCTHPVWMEMCMVKKGGQWEKKTGGTAGNGTFFHFKAAAQLLWPHIQWHRWVDLFVENWLKHKYVGVLGPKSSGKTCSAALCHLLDYYIFPTETTVIVCSDTKENLEDRIWGEIKKLHLVATRQCGWLPGHLIEGRTRIVTDDRSDDEEGRDFRNGMCFAAGTLVDCQDGAKPIESVVVGDRVINACGIGTVTATHSRISQSLVRVTFSDGRKIVCTRQHRFLTERGWIKAVALETSELVLSAHEALSLLRKTATPWLSQPKILQSGLQRSETGSALPVLRENVSSVEQKTVVATGRNVGPVLLYGLRWPVGCISQRMQSHYNKALQTLQDDHERRSFLSGVLLKEMSGEAAHATLQAMRQGIRFDPRIPEKETQPVLQLAMPQEGDWMEECATECPSDKGRATSVEAVSRICSPLSYRNRKEVETRSSALVSVGHSFSRSKAGGGSGWGRPHYPGKDNQGCRKNDYFRGAWVESVEVLEQGSDEATSTSGIGHQVFNLTVSGHPSYSVEGFLVHNCGVPVKKGGQYVGISAFVGRKNKRVRLCGDELSLIPKSFIDAIASLTANQEVKITGLGNPAQTTDALGILCEPDVSLGGWDGGIDQTPKTKTWKTRFPDGIAIQFPGSDSPNNDVPADQPIPYPYLISRKHMEEDAKIWGKEDWHYTMFNEGRMPRGQGSRRVITRQLCIKHKALEDPLWANSNRTRITALDAAYRAVGGDRCVFLEINFGEEAYAEPGQQLLSAIINQEVPDRQRRQILALVDLIVIPIKASDFESPEDQIVMFVKDQHEKRGIPPENFFFDAGMRTSLVTAFGRLWSTKVNSIDCGGKPSERQVSANIDVSCRDYYSKFVTELWFSVRLVIEAEQFRGLTEDVMTEGCAREWMTVSGNRVEVEPKAEMKLKTGYSPDKFDALTIAVEGARQKGFVIRRLGTAQETVVDHAWKRQLKERAHKAWHSKALTYK